MNNSESIQKAANDLAIIRRAIDRSKGNAETGLGNRYAIDAGLVFQGLCGLITLLLVIFEIFSHQAMSNIMMLSAQDKEVGISGLIQIGMIVPSLVMCLYFIVWRAAKHNEESFHDYVARNFQYLRNLSFVSDLLVKVTALALLVLAGHPEWISFLITLFIGDYLIQGRFFTLPVRLSLTLGFLTLIAAAFQYMNHSTTLLWPLFSFLLISSLSVITLARARMARVSE